MICFQQYLSHSIYMNYCDDSLLLRIILYVGHRNLSDSYIVDLILYVWALILLIRMLDYATKHGSLY